MIWFLVTVGGLTVAILLSVLRGLLVGEIIGWLPSLEGAVLRLAARRVPPRFRQRYREEWYAELEQLRERPLSAFAYAIQVYMRASAVSTALGARNTSERRPARESVESSISVATAIAQTQFRDGSGWDEAIHRMRGDLPLLASDIDAPLHAASKRFVALLAPAPLPALYVAARTQIKLLPRETVRPVPRDTPSTQAPAVRRRIPTRLLRNGPHGCIDPEAAIAPLTPAERRAAEPYYLELTGQSKPCLTLDWPARVQRALLDVVRLYDSGDARHRAKLKPTNIRLAAFLAVWGTGPPKLGVRRLPQGPQYALATHPAVSMTTPPPTAMMTSRRAKSSVASQSSSS